MHFFSRFTLLQVVKYVYVLVCAVSGRGPRKRGEDFDSWETSQKSNKQGEHHLVTGAATAYSFLAEPEQTLLSEKEKQENPTLLELESLLSNEKPLEQTTFPFRSKTRKVRQTNKIVENRLQNSIKLLKKTPSHSRSGAADLFFEPLHSEISNHIESFSGDGEVPPTITNSRRRKNSTVAIANHIHHIDLEASEALVKPSQVTGSGFKQNFDDEDETQADEVNFTAENRHLISHVNKKTRCTWDDVTYPIGWHFPAEDGCNLCYCELNGNISCTQLSCGCYDKKGIFREARESWPDHLDPCSICSCQMKSQEMMSPLARNDVITSDVITSDVTCTRMTLVECYMRISARQLREQRFQQFLLKRGYHNSRYKIP